MLNTLSVIGDLGRCIIRATPGSRFLAADYSGIESRTTGWVAGEQAKVNQWTRFDATGDPKDEPYYKLGIKFGLPEEKARAIGKVCDLAFGYMGSVGAYRALDPNTPLTDEEIKALRDLWRKEHPHIVRFWKMLMRASAHAMKRPGVTVPCGRVSFTYDGEMFLRMRLPSGRDLAYPMPRLITDPMYGEAAVVFKDNAKGKFVDCRDGRGAYGGTWIENAVQAIARDVFTEAMQRLEDAGYPVVLHVHDEIVCELPAGVGTKEEFHRIMTTAPAWAEGLPIAAKAHNSDRFAKIKPQNASPHANEPALVRQPDTNRTPEPKILQSFSQSPIGETIMEPAVSDETPRINDAPPTGFDADSAQAAADLFRKKANGHAKPNGYSHNKEIPEGLAPSAEFIYRQADGTPYLLVRKWVWHDNNGERQKSIKQFHRGIRSWISGAPQGPKIPYRLPELLAAPADAVVHIMEGEKDCDRGAALGLITTSNPGGACKWTDELNEHLRGRSVVIHEDNDRPGRDHALVVASALKGVAKERSKVRYPELDEGGDFSDFMDRGGTIAAMLARAKPIDDVALPFFVDTSRWDDEPAPEQEWAVPDRIPLRQVALYSGEGGAGKSTTQLQLCFAHSLMRNWLGVLPTPGPALFIDAEDDETVLRRRGGAVLAHYGSTWKEAHDGGLRLMSLKGRDPVLAALSSRKARMEPTPLFDEILEAMGDLKPKMIGIASAANVFAGSEIDRSQVQQFIDLLSRVALRANGSVVLISHPSLTGVNTDTGLSGNTQWHNAVRARFYMKMVKPPKGELPDNDLRELVFKKNQYGALSDSIILRYERGLFLPVAGVTSADRAVKQLLAKEVFMQLLGRFLASNRRVSENPSPSHAPSLFAQEEEAKAAHLTAVDFTNAMRLLFAEGKIWNEPHGPPSKRRHYLAVR